MEKKTPAETDLSRSFENVNKVNESGHESYRP